MRPTKAGFYGMTVTVTGRQMGRQMGHTSNIESESSNDAPGIQRRTTGIPRFSRVAHRIEAAGKKAERLRMNTSKLHNSSDRVPKILIVDDNSTGRETSPAIGELRNQADVAVIVCIRLVPAGLFSPAPSPGRRGPDFVELRSRACGH